MSLIIALGLSCVIAQVVVETLKLCSREWLVPKHTPGRAGGRAQSYPLTPTLWSSHQVKPLWVCSSSWDPITSRGAALR